MNTGENVHVNDLIAEEAARQKAVRKEEEARDKEARGHRRTHAFSKKFL